MQRDFACRIPVNLFLGLGKCRKRFLPTPICVPTLDVSFLSPNPDFWKIHGYLPPPTTSSDLKYKHREVLLRHGFETPSNLIDIMARSTRLARIQFSIDFAAFSIVDCEDPNRILVFGGFKDGTLERLERSGSVCSHALVATDVPQLFHLDLDSDYRFAKNPNLCTLDGTGRMKFYVSVPISLPSGNGDETIPIGRMCLISETPRSWSDAESELLKDLSTLTSDSLEKLQQKERARRMGVIQRSLTFLTRSIDEETLLDHSRCDAICRGGIISDTTSINDSSATTLSGSHCSKRVELACSSIQEVLKAQSVLAIDTSDFKIKSSDPSQSLSPGISTSASITWNTSTSSNSSTSQISESSSHSRLVSSSSIPGEDVEICPVPCQGLGLISGSKGVQIATLEKDFGTGVQRAEVAKWLETWKVEKRKSYPIVYDRCKKALRQDQDSELSDDVQTCHPLNPLASLLPNSDSTEMYIAIPVFNLDGQPMFLCLASFEKKQTVDSELLLFVENVSMTIRSSILKQRIRAAELLAQHFVQQVQVSLLSLCSQSSTILTDFPCSHFFPSLTTA